MKIISKYKDYYDYLTGIYGIDPLLILDRREYDNHTLYVPQKVIFYICGLQIEGYYDGKKFYYGDNLKKIGMPYKEHYFFRNSTDKILVHIKGTDSFVATNIILDNKNYNKINN